MLGYCSIRILFLVATVCGTTTCGIGATARVDNSLGLFVDLVPVHYRKVTTVNDEGVANTTADTADVNALVKDANTNVLPDDHFVPPKLGATDGA
jgi:hypothetical protein